MNDAQTWTLIGGFLAILVAMSGLVLRVVRVEIQALGNLLGGRIDVLEAKVDSLDRDVQRLVEHWFGQHGAP